MIRLAMLDQTVRELTWLFKESSPNEQGAFCLLREGRGLADSRLLGTKLLLPPAEAWERQKTGILRPRAQWISAAVSCAICERAGLLFVHSHPDPYHPIGMSSVDMASFESLARHLAPMLEGPFAAAVVHPYGWAGVVWSENRITPIDSIFGVGRTLRFLSLLGESSDGEMDDRQRNALGVVHERVRNLVLELVGCGGVGSPTAEEAIRMGVKRLVLIDDGFLDTPSNVRRVFGSRPSDLKKPVARRKVDVVGDHADGLEFGIPVVRVPGDVRTEQVFRNLLDTDLVINATDNHGSRAIVNDLASTYLLPVVDVGVRAGATGESASAGASKARDGGYLIGSTGAPEPSVVALTVFGSGLATCALLATLSEEGEVAPSGYWVDGFLGDAHETDPRQPVDGCRCRAQLGLGDLAPPPFLKEFGRASAASQSTS